MVLYLYSNVLGVYICDNKGKVIDSTIFKKNSIDTAKKIIHGEMLNEELNLIKKYKDEQIILLSPKKEIIIPNIKNTKLDEEELDIYEKITGYLKNTQEYSKLIDINQDFISDALRNNTPTDAIIIQCVNNVDDTERIINTLATRLREWYEIYNPELSRNIESHKEFAKALLEEKKQEGSIGAKFSKKDLEPIFRLSKEVLSLYEFMDKQREYIEDLVEEYAPNTSAVATPIITARLIAIAGGLRRMALFPASTIQTLGAEKAMFRHMKTGDRPPKYGIIIMHPLVSGAKRTDKGKTARAISGKISIAAKIDLFEGENYKGYELKEELTKQFGDY